MSEDLLELLHAANREFPRFLARAPRLAEDPNGPAELKKLSDRLGQIGEKFIAVSPSQSLHPATQTALAEYRKHLEELLPALQGVHRKLLTRRTQLATQSSHLRAARLWAASYHETV